VVKYCWNCGNTLSDETWCTTCGRLQSEDTPVVLELDDVAKVKLTPLGLALVVRDKYVLPASPKGILIKLVRR
jgi:uncharacterized membrane protein YvbJ